MADETVVVREVSCRHAVTSAASRAASSRRLGFDPEGRRRGLELTMGVSFRNKSLLCFIPEPGQTERHFRRGPVLKSANNVPPGLGPFLTNRTRPYKAQQGTPRKHSGTLPHSLVLSFSGFMICVQTLSYYQNDLHTFT
jgi:hypothetical protein